MIHKRRRRLRATPNPRATCNASRLFAGRRREDTCCCSPRFSFVGMWKFSSFRSNPNPTFFEELNLRRASIRDRGTFNVPPPPVSQIFAVSQKVFEIKKERIFGFRELRPAHLSVRRRMVKNAFFSFPGAIINNQFERRATLPFPPSRQLPLITSGLPLKSGKKGKGEEVFVRSTSSSSAIGLRAGE